MDKIGKISYAGITLDIYGTIARPCFLATDLSKIIDYSNGNTGQMLQILEADEYFRDTIFRKGQRRTVWFVNENGLHDILDQSRKPVARLWRRTISNELIRMRTSRGMSIQDQFDEWDDLLDTLYVDEKTGILMQSITVQGGDVEQVPYEE